MYHRWIDSWSSLGAQQPCTEKHFGLEETIQKSPQASFFDLVQQSALCFVLWPRRTAAPSTRWRPPSCRAFLVNPLLFHGAHGPRRGFPTAVDNASQPPRHEEFFGRRYAISRSHSQLKRIVYVSEVLLLRYLFIDFASG